MNWAGKSSHHTETKISSRTSLEEETSLPPLREERPSEEVSSEALRSRLVLSPLIRLLLSSSQ